ncbi:unnamed protein product [Leptidea sinapis]|uniref:Uncharacterized protein n=1 Tax=Leptidea sinapis TaxID=189913 RepID=A0A5E4R1L3_9NEOP|nr:unnamed protein product [Leptidea sinapis]
MNPYKELEDNSFNTSPHLTYAEIATKLLKDNYFLTALEFHTELVESGKELPQLREFFSNPGNFEQHVSRASEVSTMYTDTGLDKSSKDNFNQASLKPHEKRALNFLINEYLLLQDYKLTSITFSDENPEQEFEDWDDVGLNIPRPPGLISLFRGSTSVVHASCCDVSTQFDSDYFSDAECQTENDEANVCANCHMSMQNEASWVHEKLYDAAIISLNTLTSPASDKQSLELHMSNEKLNTAQERFEQQINQKPITYMATENHYGSSNSTQSATPEQFELIENDKHCAVVKKGGSNTSSFEPGVDSSRGSPLRPGSITTLDDTLSINDATEWTRLQLEYNVVENSKEMRAKLLHTLLTLYKKPDPPDAKILCEELLASKSPERRILASQICLAVAPYVPLELCTSLLLSLVVLMCESSESELRYFGLKSAVLICPIVEHKYGQLENILFHFLKDPVDRIVKDAVNVFLPVLARSALISGKFSSMLCNRIISNLVKASSDNDWKNVVLYLDVLRTLVISKLSVTRTCLVRGLATQANNIEPLCWPPFEELLNSRTLSNKESVKAAEALTLLVLPTVESHSVSERAVSLLCALCHRSPQSAESVAALSPESLLHVVSNETPRVPSPKPTTNLQTAQEVGRRVTQMFQHSKTNINLPNIFKKKT